MVPGTSGDEATKVSDDLPVASQRPGTAGARLGNGVLAASGCENLSLSGRSNATVDAVDPGEIATRVKGAFGASVALDAVADAGDPPDL